ncbi:MAG: hypothetical protein MUC87_00825 [Bacteroidia bacterium]|nr:hypothetical protein [Bacteroidia bacterium]
MRFNKKPVMYFCQVLNAVFINLAAVFSSLSFEVFSVTVLSGIYFFEQSRKEIRIRAFGHIASEYEFTLPAALYRRVYGLVPEIEDSLTNRDQFPVHTQERLIPCGFYFAGFGSFGNVPSLNRQ